MKKKFILRLRNFCKKHEEKQKEKEIVSRNLTREEFSDILSQMEKFIQGKIDSLKSSLPIFFTIISSVIAFFFVEDFKVNINEPEQVKMLLWITGVSWGLLCLILISNFSIYRYKSRFEIPLENDFKPWDIGTYIWVGDEQFVIGMEKCAGYQLNQCEKIRLNILKEKINEFRKKNFFMCLVYAIIIACLVYGILGVILYGATL